MRINAFYFAFSFILLVLVSTSFSSETRNLSTGSVANESVAQVKVGEDGLRFVPIRTDAGMLVAVSGPEEYHFRQQFMPAIVPFLPVSIPGGATLADGVYTYELRVVPLGNQTRDARLGGGPRVGELSVDLRKVGGLRRLPVQIGHFRIRGGSVVTETDAAEVLAKDIPLFDDTIVDGRMCVGIDCEVDEDFSSHDDTLRLKQDILRIHFDDTSSDPGFPSNSWRISVNDTESTGVDRFSIEDADASTTPFSIRSGAPDGSLFVDPQGRLGLGTAVPAADLDIADAWPEIRLSPTSVQDANVWAIQLNPDDGRLVMRDDCESGETERIPFKIEMGAADDLLRLGFPDSDSAEVGGNLEIGGVATASRLFISDQGQTYDPGTFPFEVETTNQNAVMVFGRTDGASVYFNATDDYANVGSLSSHPFRIAAGASWRVRLDTDNSLTMRNGAICDSTGHWLDASASRKMIVGLAPLQVEEARAALAGLNPVRYAEVSNQGEERLGFIADELPNLVATKSRQHVDDTRIVAVLTKVVQDQQHLIAALQRRLVQLEREIEELHD